MILELPSRNNIPGCSVPLPAWDNTEWPGHPASRHFISHGAEVGQMEDSEIYGLVGSWFLPFDLGKKRKGWLPSTSVSTPSPSVTPTPAPPSASGPKRQENLRESLWSWMTCAPAQLCCLPSGRHGLPLPVNFLICKMPAATALTSQGCAVRAAQVSSAVRSVTPLLSMHMEQSLTLMSPARARVARFSWGSVYKRISWPEPDLCSTEQPLSSFERVYPEPPPKLSFSPVDVIPV